MVHVHANIVNIDFKSISSVPRVLGAATKFTFSVGAEQSGSNIVNARTVAMKKKQESRIELFERTILKRKKNSF